MKEFAGRIAVVTGGGSGMGRELVGQLVAEACNVAMCDLAAEGMAETIQRKPEHPIPAIDSARNQSTIWSVDSRPWRA